LKDRFFVGVGVDKVVVVVDPITEGLLSGRMVDESGSLNAGTVRHVDQWPPTHFSIDDISSQTKNWNRWLETVSKKPRD
jgi:hypothetical protein